MRPDPPKPRITAHEQMLREDQEAGVDVFDDHGVPRPALGPPPQPLQPVPRFQFPPVDWRAELEERERRDREEQRRREAADDALRREELRRSSVPPEPAELAPPPPESLSSRPAKPQRSPRRDVVTGPTPNLDRVREWLREGDR